MQMNDLPDLENTICASIYYVCVFISVYVCVCVCVCITNETMVLYVAWVKGQSTPVNLFFSSKIYSSI